MDVGGGGPSCGPVCMAPPARPRSWALASQPPPRPKLERLSLRQQTDRACFSSPPKGPGREWGVSVLRAGSPARCRYRCSGTGQSVCPQSSQRKRDAAQCGRQGQTSGKLENAPRPSAWLRCRGRHVVAQALSVQCPQVLSSALETHPLTRPGARYLHTKHPLRERVGAYRRWLCMRVTCSPVAFTAGPQLRPAQCWRSGEGREQSRGLAGPLAPAIGELCTGQPYLSCPFPWRGRGGCRLTLHGRLARRRPAGAQQRRVWGRVQP